MNQKLKQITFLILISMTSINAQIISSHLKSSICYDAVAGGEGDIYVAASGIKHFDGENWTDLITDMSVQTLYTGMDRKTYYGSAFGLAGLGFGYLDSSSLLGYTPINFSAPFNNAGSIHQLADSKLIIYNGGYLAALNNNNNNNNTVLWSLNVSDSPVFTQYSKALGVDEYNHIWIGKKGYSGSGLLLFDETGVAISTLFSSTEILDVKHDDFSKCIWISTKTGVKRINYDNSGFVSSSPFELQSLTIDEVEPIDEEWLSMRIGLNGEDGAALYNHQKNEYINITSHLDNNRVRGLSLIKGDLWCLTQEGVTVFDWQTQLDSISFLEVDVTGIKIDDVSHELVVNVPEGTNLSLLTPTYYTSDGSSTDSGGSVANFTDTVFVDVITDDGVKNQQWVVKVVIDGTLSNNSNILVEKDYHCFPNPTSSILTIPSNIKIKEVNIYSINGSYIGEFTTTNNQLDVSALKDGIYILKSKEFNYKLIKRNE